MKKIILCSFLLPMFTACKNAENEKDRLSEKVEPKRSTEILTNPKLVYFLPKRD